MNQPVEAPERATLSFCVHYLANRDELLLKSIVRLLSHRCRHAWIYVPYATVKNADLVISGDFTRTVVGTSQRGIQQSLMILGGEKQANCPSYLRLPLHADELEHELNLLGDLITLRQATPPISNQADTKQPAPPSEATSAPRSLSDSQLTSAPLTLLRWPAAQLIATRERQRMATMMLSQPLTLTALVQRAELDPAVCRAFVSDLSRAGFIRAGSAESQSSASGIAAERTTLAPVHVGLLARIRSRLGLPSFGS